MIEEFDFTIEVTDTREVSIVLPKSIPIGPVKLHVVVTPQGEEQGMTLGHLLGSEFFGMWRDRTDITDSVAFSHQLRQRAWQRGA